MNIMNKLTLQHIKQNKRRTILTIVGIILSVAMFTAVSTGITSCLKWMENLTMEATGKWQVSYQGVPTKNITLLQQDEDIDTLSLIYTNGYGILEGYDNQLKEKEKDNAKPYVYLSSYDQNAFFNMPVKLLSGRFPKKDNEIVLPEHLLETMKTPYKIGDTITLDMGKRFLVSDASKEDLDKLNMFPEIGEKVELNQRIEYLGEKKSFDIGEESKHTIEVGEKFETTGDKKEYTIVGIIKKPEFMQEFTQAPGYTAMTYLKIATLDKNTVIDAYTYDSNVTTAIYDKSKEMAKKLGIDSSKTDEMAEESVTINQEVLFYSGVTKDDNFNFFIKLLTAILDVIIMVGSISLIYNSFAISISERSKQLGMLSSVGATKKQKRNTVLFEAFLLGIIGIPLGVLAGILGLSVAFVAVNPIFSDIIETSVKLYMFCSVKSIIIPIAFAIVTIFVSAYLPARRASKITPMEAIRQSKDVKITAKTVKTSKMTKKIFGLEGEIALKNMKRNKKRYRSLIFSLFISVVLFISVASYIHYMTKAFYIGKGESNFDVYIGSEDITQDDFSDITKELRDYSSVKQASLVTNTSFTLSDKQKTDIIRKEFSDFVKNNFRITYEPSFDIVGMDEIAFQEYCTTLGIDPKDYGQTDSLQGILINYYRLKTDYTIQDMVPFKVKEGENISLQYSSENGADTKTISINIGKITKEIPLGIMGYGSTPKTPVRLVVPEKTLQTIIQKLTVKEEDIPRPELFLLANDKEQIGKDIEAVMTKHEYAEHNFTCYNMFEIEKVNRQLVFAMSIFAYGFIILMSLICCANMCNTISTSIALRRKEFSMLRSVGMTPGVFRRMIMYESLLYGIKALLYGIPVSMLIAFGIYKAVAPQISVGFALPLNIFVIAIVVVFAVVGLAMAYSSRKVRKETIIDGLKEDIL